jgi:AraC-like DNA-binding protein
MLVTRPLARGSSVSIDEVVCPGGPRHPGTEEAAVGMAIALPRSGVFVRWHGQRSTVADATHALLFRAGEGYRVSHPCGHGDVCTVFRLDPALADELVGAASAAQVPTRTVDDLAHARLLARLRSGLERLAAEEEALALLRRLSFAPRANHVGALRGPTAGRRRLAERARELLTARATEDVALGDLAREVGCSPFHLCRVFRQVTGTTLHRYLRRLRVRAAVDALAAGPSDLTTLALDLGFYDHSHFTNSFRAETGLTPTAFRASLV